MTKRYRKSSYSSGGGQGSCVEIEVTKPTAPTSVRDSKNPTGPELEFEDRGPVARLLAAIKAGKL